MKDCPDCSEDQGKKLKVDLNQSKKMKNHSGGAQRVKTGSVEEDSTNSVLLPATFGDRLRDVVVADISADFNLGDENLLLRIWLTGADV